MTTNLATDLPDWSTTIDTARTALAALDKARAEIARLGDAATAEVTKYLRGSGIDLDLNAIRATLTHPYTILPIDQHEAWLIHWRGVRMPILGWVVKQEDAFIVSRVSRSMDLLTPIPQWMKEEMGWEPPEHKAIISGDRTTIAVTEGDEGTFKHRYGAFLGRKANGGYQIKGGGAWIKLVAALIRDGILPYLPQPVAELDWNPKAKSPIHLRDYQHIYIDEFLAKGAVFWNLPPGGGKTYAAIYAINHFAGGDIALFAPSLVICEQWRERLNQFASGAPVSIFTYTSGKKALDREWGLVIFDEVQTLPANEFSKLAFLKTKYRIGMSGSAWREDGRQYMIAALSGFPCVVRWAELIGAGVLKKPRIIVAIVKDDASKLRYVQSLIARHRSGHALVFCDYIQQGQALANVLDVPFIHGGTKGKYKRIQETPICVVSRVADRGLDLPDLRLVVEVAFLGKSREQEAQRVGRLLHAQESGEHYLVFTQAEYSRYKQRIYGVEAETAGEIDIEYRTIDGAKAEREAPSGGRTPRTTKAARRARIQVPERPAAARALKNDAAQSDELSAIISLPAVAAKLAKAEQIANYPAYVRRVLRLCYSAAFTPEEMAEGLGLTGNRTVSRLASACRALVQVDLFTDAQGRYTVRRDEINRLQALAQAVR
ncbi:MAG TPA: helicase-related protein [Anaerolineae bacterium]|nr:helicase-related protein [Anaerolineae bacterium]